MHVVSHPPYISISKGMSGWFAICLAWYEDIQSYDVQQSGIGRYDNREDAVAEAEDWAMSEGIKCIV